MRGGPRLALLCALPWLLRAAAPRSPAQPLARRPDPQHPARDADFDRVYSGVVDVGTEDIYSFTYTSQPGQVRHALAPSAPGNLPGLRPRGGFGSFGGRPRETSGAGGPWLRFWLRAVPAQPERRVVRSRSWEALRLHPAPPRASPRPAAGLSGLSRGAGSPRALRVLATYWASV